MIVPTEINVTAYRNGDYRDQFGPVQLDGVTVDLTGYTITMQVKATAAFAATKYIDLSSAAPNAAGSTIVITTPAGGLFEVYIKKAEMTTVLIPEASDAAAALALAYDIRLQKPSAGDTYPYIFGLFNLKHGVTF